MDDLVIRDLSDDARKVLEDRAERHGQSVEAEARQILEAAADPFIDGNGNRVGLGTALHRLSQCYGGVELEFERDKTPWEPAKFD